MWLILGLSAIITAALNVVLTLCNNDAKWFRYLSISLTALTMCAEYSTIAKWVLHEDWNALMDVVPTISKWLWILVFASITINSISLLKTHSNK